MNRSRLELTTLRAFVTSAALAMVVAGCGGGSSGGGGGAAQTPSASASELSASGTTARPDGADAVTLTVVVRDSGGQPVSGATVELSATNGATITPATATTSTTGTTQATLTATTPGDVVVTARAANGGTTVVLTASVTVRFEVPAVRLTLSREPADATADLANVSLTVRVEDASGNLASTATLPVTISVVSGPGALGGTVTRTPSAGVATFDDLELTGAGTYTLRATAAGLTEAVSQTFVISPAAAATLDVTGVPSPIVAGSAADVTVTARDAFDNVATGYTGTVSFTSSDGAALLPADATFAAGDAGVKTVSGLELRTAGSQSLTATDTVTASITGAQAGIDVSPAGAATLSVTGVPSPVVAGASTSVTVTAVDAFGNVASGYAGTVSFTSSDGAALLPADATFAAGDAGAKTVSGLELRTAGTHSVTATDTVTATISGSQSGITVLPPTSITQVTPDRGPLEGGTALTIDGDRFLAGCVVRVAGVDAANVVVVSATQVTCEAPPGVLGLVDVEVENPGEPAGVLPDAFAYEGFEPEALLPAAVGDMDAPQSVASVGVSGDRVVMAWRDDREAHPDVHYRTSADGGATWSVDARLNTDVGASSQDRPSVGVSGDRVVVAWTDDRSGDLDIYYRASADGGATWSVDARLNTDAGTALQQEPSAGASGDRVVVAWTDHRSGDADVYCRTSADGGVTWSADTRLNTDAGAAAQTRPSVGISGARIVVAWRDDRDGDADVYYRTSGDGGLTWSPDARLNTDAAGQVQEQPSVGVSGDRVVVAWTDDREGGSNAIFYRASADGGVNWSADARLTETVTPDERSPSVGVSGDRVVVAWCDLRDAATRASDIYIRTSADGGVTWSTERRLNTDNVSNAQQEPSAGVSADRIVVAWTDPRNGDLDIYYRRSTNGGATWSINTRVETAEPLRQELPQVARTGSGRVIVATGEPSASDGYDAFVRTSDDGGATWSSRTRLNADAGAAYQAQLSLGASGDRVLAAWYDNRNGYDIYHRTSADGGATWSAEVRLTNHAADQGSPSVGVSGDQLVMAWYDKRDGNAAIYYRASENGGADWSADERLNLDTTGERSAPSVGVSGARVVVAWVDERAGDSDIYCRASVNGGAETRLNTNVDPVRQEAPSVAVSGDRVVVAWYDEREGNGDIYYRTSADGGATWSADARLNTDAGTASQSEPSVGVAGDRVVVAWSDTRNGDRDIYHRVSADGGATWSADARLNTDAGTAPQLFPRVCVAADGEVYVVWADFGGSIARAAVRRGYFRP